MNELEELLRQVPATSNSPFFFDLSKEEDAQKLTDLLRTGSIRRVCDDYEEQQRELFAIENPSRVYAPDFEQAFQAHYRSIGPTFRHGVWVYFPWLSTISHILKEEQYIRVRTARNRNLITEDEQKHFYNAIIGIAGLSVGSSVAFAIALQGGGKRLRLADMDHLALSNTNRVLAGAPDLGVPKVVMAARRIFEINPYIEIELYPDGLTEDNIEQFFEGLSVVIDELDNLAMKYLIREHAQQKKIAVVMAADNGDNAVVDIERYDLDPQPAFFQGRIGDVSYNELKKLDKFGIGKTITKHIGPENVTVRMQQSLLEMGKTIVSWPQLGGAAMINGAAVAYCVRKIVNAQPLEHDRALISLDEKLTPGYGSHEETARRATAATIFRKTFGL